MKFEPPAYACEGTLWFILFFAPAAFGATEWWARAVVQSLIFLLAAMCALRRDFFSPVNTSLSGIFVILILGVLQILQQHPLMNPSLLFPATLSREQTLYALLSWAALAALLWATSGILRWHGAPRRLAWAIFFVAIFLALVGIYQRGIVASTFYGFRPIQNGYPFGPFTNYNHAATWLAASVLIGTGLLFGGFPGKTQTPVSETIAKRTLMFFSLVILLAALRETGSRGSINSLIVAIFATWYLSVAVGARLRGSMRAGLLLAMASYLIFLYSDSKWVGVMNGTLDPSAAYRVSMYWSGLRMFLDNPLYGVGLGTFANGFHPYQGATVVGFVDHIHSSWMEIALETGLIGIAAFAVFISSPVAAIIRANSITPWRPATAGCFAAISSFVIHGCVEFSFQIYADAVLLIVLVALASAHARRDSEIAEYATERRSAVLAIGFAALAIVCLPPGIDGHAPRLGAPFANPGDALLATREAKNPDISKEGERLRNNPLDPTTRHRYGMALWSAGRRRDAGQFLQSDGKKL